MLCSAHQRVTDCPLFWQSATRWLHSMRFCRAFALRIVISPIFPSQSMRLAGNRWQYYRQSQKSRLSRFDSMEVYESHLHSLTTGGRFQSGLSFDAYSNSNNSEGVSPKKDYFKEPGENCERDSDCPKEKRPCNTAWQNATCWKGRFSWA